MLREMGTPRIICKTKGQKQANEVEMEWRGGLNENIG